tara:strand:- start:1193 stop:1618 length:426 start_codon:yes stop_codon:yes gene_type:complete
MINYSTLTPAVLPAVATAFVATPSVATPSVATPSVALAVATAFVATPSLPDQFRTNIHNGKKAEVYATFDLIQNGFSILYTGGRGNDFLCIKLNPPTMFYVEVKLNKSRLSKTQRKFQNKCKKQNIEYFIYRVSSAQLEEF